MLSRLRKGKKVSLAQPAPRLMEEIQKDYQQTALAAGQAQYQAYVFSKDVEKLNQRLISINQEAAARKKLDAEAAAKKEGQADESKSQG